MSVLRRFFTRRICRCIGTGHTPLGSGSLDAPCSAHESSMDEALPVRARPVTATRSSRPHATGTAPMVAALSLFMALSVPGMSWAAPEGGRLLLVRGGDFSNSDILALCLQTGKLARIAAGMYGDWSPDGRTLVVQRVVHPGRPLRTALFLVSATGRERPRLTSSSLAAYWPTWTPSGRIVYTREARPNRGYLFYTAGALWSIGTGSGPPGRLSTGLPAGSVAFLAAAGPGGQLIFSVIRPPIRHQASKPGADLYMLDRSRNLRPLVTDPASDSVGPAAWSQMVGESSSSAAGEASSFSICERSARFSSRMDRLIRFQVGHQAATASRSRAGTTSTR